MKITIGEWRTEKGDKWHIDFSSDYGSVGHNKDGDVAMWNDEHHRIGFTREHNLIAPWTDPVPWDWSTTPPWINWIAMWDDGEWFMFDKEPVLEAAHMGWIGSGAKSVSYAIPHSHAPKWSGDWKLSKTMRPGYKEVK